MDNLNETNLHQPQLPNSLFESLSVSWTHISKPGDLTAFVQLLKKIASQYVFPFDCQTNILIIILNDNFSEYCLKYVLIIR